MTTAQIKEEIKKTGLYDLLANKGHELTKDQVLTMFKEFNYKVYDEDKSLEKNATKSMITEMEEM